MALDKNKVCNVMLGMMGERIVAKILRDRGQQVEESLDPFDAEKDMFVDGERVEVKTQVPILTENSFAVSVRQRTKLYNCRYHSQCLIFPWVQKGAGATTHISNTKNHTLTNCLQQ